ncbi:MAG: PAS domain S-box protein, partial [bacterium]|nr:PAS domain S-box protein [bacterium]
FRPYFKKAIRGSSAIYMALGTASGERGVYYSYPVVDPRNHQPTGVAVIKVAVEEMEDEFTRFISGNEALLLTDPHGIVFISSRKDWLFHSLWQLSAKDTERIVASRQFGEGPWEWLGFTRSAGSGKVLDEKNREMGIYEETIDAFPGWKIIYLRSLPSPWAVIMSPIQHVPGALISVFFVLVVGSVLYLYRKAHLEIVHRRETEQALKESERRYRGLYLNTPAMLHSIDPAGTIVSVSDYWSDVLGYERKEVLGRKATDFMTAKSKRLAEEVMIPEFLRVGFCKNVAYEFVKKDGQVIDVLLSSIAERASDGKILRSLSVLVDVTEVKRIEKALKKATEELSSHSRHLERQVRERTREISNILKYTPAIVYLKDTEGRYLLINSRFENLFGVDLDQVRGKADREIFDLDTAQQFELNDKEVLERKAPLQIEERVPVGKAFHVYISVKFPLFDDDQKIIGLGGISTDITDLKKAQDQLRQMSNRILTSQERERASIARELHDELGQALTALKLESTWLEKRLKTREAEAAARAQAMSALIDKTIDEVRNMAIRLRPGVLDHLGLISALEWLVDDFEKRLDIPCTFRHHNVPDLDDVMSMTVYRITQEALTNVARHANASRAVVSLIADHHEMRLSIQDDGQGFDTRSFDDAESLGIVGIKERADLIDATVTIDSGPNEGSLIQVRFSLENVTG